MKKLFLILPLIALPANALAEEELFRAIKCKGYLTSQGGSVVLNGKEDKNANTYNTYIIEKTGAGIGNIAFYTGSEKRTRSIYFETRIDSTNIYLDESGNPDKADGYIERAKAYAKKSNYAFPDNPAYTPNCHDMNSKKS